MEGIQVVGENLEIRLQRAGSWMRLAKELERAIDEPREASEAMALPKWARSHELFIFYWIAFNALYGTEGEKEWPKLEAFLKKVETMAKLEEVENISILEEAIRNCLSDGETVILDKFLDKAYWEGLRHENDVIEECQRRCRKAKQAMTQGKCFPFLSAVFDHLRVLRNQIMHGSASHGQSSKGYKDSLLPGLRVLRTLVPAFFVLVRDYGNSPGLDWGKVPFPRYGSDGHPWKSQLRLSRRAE
jgi:hypothetical protein